MAGGRFEASKPSQHDASTGSLCYRITPS